MRKPTDSVDHSDFNDRAQLLTNLAESSTASRKAIIPQV